MTEDGRFIVFDVSGGERGNQKSFAVADLLRDEVRPLEIRGSIPFLDTASALLYWFEPGGRAPTKSNTAFRTSTASIPACCWSSPAASAAWFRR